MDLSFTLQTLSWPDAVLKVLLSLAFGFLTQPLFDEKDKMESET
jgi:hypothetical protein